MSTSAAPERGGLSDEREPRDMDGEQKSALNNKDGTGAKSPDDLGLGRVVVQDTRGRFFDRAGNPTAKKYGLGAQRAERFYLAALNARWPSFVLWMLGILLLANGIFALMYVAIGASAIAGGDSFQLSDPFLRALEFSVGIFTTAGASPMYAVGVTANWLMIVESFVGPLILVAASGLLIARLTRPRVNIRFSESLVIAPYESGRGLMFRMVNMRPGELSDVRVRLNLSWFEEEDGKRERNFHSLELERNQVEFFTLHWTVVHPISASSPLAGVTPERLRQSQAEFLVLVNAHEDTFSTRVISRTSYVPDEVTWDAKFASIFANSSDGSIAIDVERLDRVERLEEGATRVPAPIEGAG